MLNTTAPRKNNNRKNFQFQHISISASIDFYLLKRRNHYQPTQLLRTFPTLFCVHIFLQVREMKVKIFNVRWDKRNFYCLSKFRKIWIIQHGRPIWGWKSFGKLLWTIFSHRHTLTHKRTQKEKHKTIETTKTGFKIHRTVKKQSPWQKRMRRKKNTVKKIVQRQERGRNRQKQHNKKVKNLSRASN